MFDLGGVGYLLRCITEDYDTPAVQWQWLLGRFYMLDVLIEDNTPKFIIRPFMESEQTERSPREPYKHYERVFSILKFSVSAMTFAHQKVSKMARRVFYVTAKLQVHIHGVFKEILGILDSTDMNMQVYMRRKLLKVMEESQMVEEKDPGEEHGHHPEEEGAEEGEPIPPFTTPVVSAASTPRCNSPMLLPASPRGVTNAILVPEVPPNSPNYKRVRQQSCQSLSSMTSGAMGDCESVSSGMTSSVEAIVEEADIDVLADVDVLADIDVLADVDFLADVDVLATPLDDVHEECVCSSLMITSTPLSGRVDPPATSNVVLTPPATPHQGLDHSHNSDNGEHTPGSSSTMDSSRLHKHASMVVEVSDACISTSPTLCIRGLNMNFDPIGAMYNVNAPPLPLPPPPSRQDRASQTENLATRPCQLFSFPLEPSYGEDKEVQTPDTLSEIGDDLDIPIPGPDDLEVGEGGELATANATFNTTPGAFLTEDLSDLTMSPSAPEDKVSFKTEVASSPQQSSAGLCDIITDVVGSWIL